jgi:cobalt/nickel transport system permease protein
MKIRRVRNRIKSTLWLALAALLGFGIQPALARPMEMHIMEGFLPLGWAVFWWGVAIPAWLVGFIQIRKLIAEKPQQRITLGLAGGFIFVLSALKIPSVTGSSSHPTGTALGTMLFGPFVTGILGTIVLFLQATLMAHGGISTLGANAVSMAIGGPLVAYFLVWLPLKGKAPTWLSVGLTAFVADLFTYMITTTELALAFPDPLNGFAGSWLTFAGIFALTQIPLAVSEAILTVLVFNALQSSAASELKELGLQGV